MISGPRDSVVNHLLGIPVSAEEWVTDTSEWVVFDRSTYDWREWPELWTDKIHDFVDS